MAIEKKKQVFEEFAQYITQARRTKIEHNAQQRTRYVTVVLEDIFQGHNISAVLRSCDGFGIQDVHIIEDKHRYNVREEVAKGAAQWLSLKHYMRTEGAGVEDCFAELKSAGYLLVATTPHEKDMLIEDIPLDKKIALVFGTEQSGLSSYALSHADMYVKIPMYGFTESFNISVCAGISLYELTKRLRASSFEWKLSPEELIDLELEWLGKTTYRTDQIRQKLDL
jgi:tRNA (guanosine-2'-O-)-methyltransferase